MSDYERCDDLDRDVVEVMTDLMHEVRLTAGMKATETEAAEAEAAEAEAEVERNLVQLVVTIQRRLLALLARTEPRLDQSGAKYPAEGEPAGELSPWEPP